MSSSLGWGTTSRSSGCLRVHVRYCVRTYLLYGKSFIRYTYCPSWGIYCIYENIYTKSYIYIYTRAKSYLYIYKKQRAIYEKSYIYKINLLNRIGFMFLPRFVKIDNSCWLRIGDTIQNALSTKNRLFLDVCARCVRNTYVKCVFLY